MSEYARVVQIGEARVRLRGGLGFRDDRCKHKNLTYDDNGEIVTCDDCSARVSAFWAMKMLMEHYETAISNVKHREKAIAEETSRSIHLLAARKVEAAWKKRNMVPCCPHCWAGILPEDGFGGSQVNRAIEMRRRAALPKNTRTEPKP